MRAIKPGFVLTEAKRFRIEFCIKDDVEVIQSPTRNRTVQEAGPSDLPCNQTSRNRGIKVRKTG